MNTTHKAREVILKHLKESTALHELATESLISGIMLGYCEYTEHSVLWPLIKSFTCEYCGKFHELSDCRVYGAEEYRQHDPSWPILWRPTK